MAIPEKGGGVRIECALLAHITGTVRLLLLPTQDSDALPENITVKFALEGSEKSEVFTEAGRNKDVSKTRRVWLHVTLAPQDRASAILSVIESSSPDVGLNMIKSIRLSAPEWEEVILDRRANGAFRQEGCHTRFDN